MTVLDILQSAAQRQEEQLDLSNSNELGAAERTSPDREMDHIVRTVDLGHYE